MDYVIQKKGNSLLETANQWKDHAKQSAIDYGFHLIITQPNETSSQELDALVELGITSFKLFMANEIAMSDRELFSMMRELRSGEYCSDTCRKQRYLCNFARRICCPRKDFTSLSWQNPS